MAAILRRRRFDRPGAFVELLRGSLADSIDRRMGIARMAQPTRAGGGPLAGVGEAIFCAAVGVGPDIDGDGFLSDLPLYLY